MPKQTLREKRGQKLILDPRWFMHLTPKELHKHFAAFGYNFRDYLGRYTDPALKWDVAGMKGKMLKIPVGSLGPVIHIMAMATGYRWRYHSIASGRRKGRLPCLRDKARIRAGWW